MNNSRVYNIVHVEIDVNIEVFKRKKNSLDIDFDWTKSFLILKTLFNLGLFCFQPVHEE